MENSVFRFHFSMRGVEENNNNSGKNRRLISLKERIISNLSKSGLVVKIEKQAEEPAIILLLVASRLKRKYHKVYSARGAWKNTASPSSTLPKSSRNKADGFMENTNLVPKTPNRRKSKDAIIRSN